MTTDPRPPLLRWSASGVSRLPLDRQLTNAPQVPRQHALPITACRQAIPDDGPDT
jgi:hypothetical protein